MITEHELASPLLQRPRSVWVQRSPHGPAEVCLIFLDGELYLNRVKAPDIVARLQEEGRLPPVGSVYVSCVDSAARHTELTCNERFAQFIATDLLGWIRSNVGHFGRYVLCGLSLSGLSAAFTALRYPEIFSGILSQSPSAWWNNEWLAASLTQARPVHGRFWLSVGTRELEAGVAHPPTGLLQKTCQLDSVRRLSQRLKDVGVQVHHVEYDGGHDPVCWAAELPEALAWLITLPGVD